jgi:hypothetical protein
VIISAIADLRIAGLLLDDEHGLRLVLGKEAFYQVMRPWNDDEVLDILITYLDRAGKSASEITGMDNALQLYLSDKDHRLYESLLKRNTWVQYWMDGNIVTFRISDVGVEGIARYGSYLNYLKSLRRNLPEEKAILQALVDAGDGFYPLDAIFDAAGVEKDRKRIVLAKLEGFILRGNSVISPYLDPIAITDKGLLYLEGYTGGVSRPERTKIHIGDSITNYGSQSSIGDGNVAFDASVTTLNNLNAQDSVEERKANEIGLWTLIWTILSVIVALAIYFASRK